MSAAKKKLLEQRIKMMKERGKKQGIARRPREEASPLSLAQQRLWFFYQLEPESSVYNLPTSVRITGPLNIEALKKSIQFVIERHESLRTTFEVRGGEPVQIVHPIHNFSLPIVDLSMLDIDEQKLKLHQLEEEEAQKPFRLEEGPVIRVKLIRLSDEEWVLLLNMHHIVSDGWSMGVFIQEVTERYAALVKGEELSDDKLPIQYIDFAYWQKETLEEERLEKQFQYWKEKLSDVPILQLPTDYPRPTRQTFSGKRIYFTIHSSLLEKVKAFCQKEGVTLFMALLTTYKALLYRYTGQTDFAVGTPIANRNRPEIEKLIGFFVNTLVLRDSFHPEISFRQLMQQVRQTCIEAFVHPDVPFEKLVSELAQDRNLSYSPLFQTMFVLQQSPQLKEVVPGVSMEWTELSTGSSMFDLTFSMKDSDKGLTGFVEYNTDLFDSSTIERMVQHFEKLLESALSDPDQSIATLPMLTDLEIQLFNNWNQTKKDVKLASFHQLFAEVAERFPQHVALYYQGQTMTYEELNARSNQLAHYLMAEGLQKGSFVAISLDRSFEMIIAVLGVLKAGGAYIPLDPTYPKQRLSFMLEDSKAPLLLTKRKLLDQIPTNEAKVICIDDCLEKVQQLPKTEPEILVTLDDIAYMIYTSGSTGKPKGVMVSHRGLGNVIQEQRHLFEADEESRVLQFASFSFDASMFEFCMAFGVGATLFLADKEDLLPGSGLIQFLKEHRITHATLSPSVLNAMPDAELPDLKVIVTAGEACTEQIVNRFAPGRRLFNAYGPTETTIWVTTKRCRPDEGKPTIGVAIGNVKLYVLDAYQQRVPLGVPGELYIGGIGLAKGYFGREDLTKERFISHPFEPGEKLYRTGDLVRFLPNGEVDFLGRVDDQVKIRGFRIELGEIEHLLNQHPDVKASVVIVHEDQSKRKRLVAYVVPNEKKSEFIFQLRQYLKQKLPDFMVPSFLIELEKLPMTSNGKVDKKALPLPEESHLEREVVEARNPVEAKLVKIWSEVLGVQSVGIYDNFFELGGDSILGIQVITRAKEEGIHLKTKHLFEYQTIAELAQVAEIKTVKIAKQEKVEGEAPLTPIQQWFFEQEIDEAHHWNQAIMLKVKQPLNETLFKEAIYKVIEHHDTLRFKYVKENGKWKQMYAEQWEVPWIRYQIEKHENSEEAMMRYLDSLQAQLNLEEAPLIRFVWLVEDMEKPSYLAIIAHHLIIDGVSWRILLEDLLRAYTMLKNGQEVVFAPKTTSYKKWGQLLIEWANGDHLKPEIEFWMNQLQQTVPALPKDHHGENRVAFSQTITRRLSEEQTQKLLHEVPSAYRTQINDILLTALALTLSEWTSHDRFLIDLESHGRQDLIEEADITRTIGWFTAKYPLLLKKDQEKIGDLLKSVKEQLRAIPNQGFSYGAIKYLRLDEWGQQLKQDQKPEIAFNYLGQFDLIEESLFEKSDKTPGKTRSEREMRTHLLEIDSMVVHGQLQIDWTFSTQLYQQKTIEALADRYLAWLNEIIDHCLSDEAGGFTPSDFKEFGWTQEELDQITFALVRTLGGKADDPQTN